MWPTTRITELYLHSGGLGNEDEHHSRQSDYRRWFKLFQPRCDKRMPFWQPSWIINWRAVIVLIVTMENKHSLFILLHQVAVNCIFFHSYKLESSRRPQASASAMLFARWQQHIRFGSNFPYAPLKAMLTKISKWSRIQDSFRITPKIESLVVFAIPDIPRKFQKDSSITFWVILLTDRQTSRQSLAKT